MPALLRRTSRSTRSGWFAASFTAHAAAERAAEEGGAGVSNVADQVQESPPQPCSKDERRPRPPQSNGRLLRQRHHSAARLLVERLRVPGQNRNRLTLQILGEVQLRVGWVLAG
jgi:hypothetical protein